MPIDACLCLGVTENATVCLFMLRDDHEYLGMAANMTNAIKLAPFFTCDVLLTLIEKG